MTNVTVTSAIQLSAAQTAKVKKMVDGKVGKDEVKYVFAVDSVILGGLQVTINSKMLDDSVKTRLENVRQELKSKILLEN